jgi:hypothetical protein
VPQHGVGVAWGLLELKTRPRPRRRQARGARCAATQNPGHLFFPRCSRPRAKTFFLSTASVVEKKKKGAGDVEFHSPHQLCCRG